MSLWFYGYAGRRALFLLLFKYDSFFIENANLLLKTDFSARTFLLPLGISFLTFGQLSFVIDAYRNEMVPCSLLEYAVFISFFPKISSGPITTNRQFLPLLQEEERKRVDWGALHGCFMVFTRANREKMEKIPRLPGQLLTFTFVNLAWVLFRAETLGQAGAMFAALFAGGFGKLPAELIACLQIPYLHSLLGTWVPAGVEAACLVGTVLLVVLAGKNTAARAAKGSYGIGKALAAAAVAALSLLSFSNVSTFLYFNF